jgi:hypothetical protein
MEKATELLDFSSAMLGADECSEESLFLGLVYEGMSLQSL